MDAASRWKLLKIYNLRIRNSIIMWPFIREKIWASPIGRRKECSINLWKNSEKSFFWPNFQEFLRVLKKSSHIWCCTLHCVIGKVFVQIKLDLGLQSMKTIQKQPKLPLFPGYNKLWKYLTWQPHDNHKCYANENYKDYVSP